MNVNYIGSDYNVVGATYEVNRETNKVYNFKVDKRIIIKEGDLAVVEASNGYGLVRVLVVYTDELKNPNPFSKATAWVVNKVDTILHQKRKELTERRVMILRKLEEKRQEAEALKVYETLKPSMPGADKLLLELEDINKSL